MERSLEYGEDAVVAHLDSAEILQPGVGALDFPTLAVAAQLAVVLKATVATVLSVGNDQLRTLSFQSPAQRIGVIAPIGNDAPERWYSSAEWVAIIQTLHQSTGYHVL